MTKQALVIRGLILLLLLFVFLPISSFAGSLRWTCPECGQTFEFDPRDSAYRDSFIQNHLAAHGSGSSGSSYSGDPSTALMGTMMNQAMQLYQQGVEQQRQQQLQQQQLMQQQLREQQLRQEEEARIREQNKRQQQQQFDQDKNDLLNQLSGGSNGTLEFRDLSAPQAVPLDKPAGFAASKHVPAAIPPQGRGIVAGGQPLRSGGYPIVPADKLGLLDRADLKAFIGGMSKEDLQQLDDYLRSKEAQLTKAIEHLKDKEARAILAGYSAPDYQLWTQAVRDKVMDDAPLARTMEALGQKAGGADADVSSADFNYKTYSDAEGLAGRLTEGKGIAEVDAAMAYKKFTEADNFKEGTIAALPYAGSVAKKLMPEPEDLAKFGKRTVGIAEKGSTVIDAMEQVSDIGYRGMDMHMFNEGVRQNKAANKTLAIELRSQKDYFSGKISQIKDQEKLIQEELRRR